jgi:hypothetical protein
MIRENEEGNEIISGTDRQHGLDADGDTVIYANISRGGMGEAASGGAEDSRSGCSHECHGRFCAVRGRQIGALLVSQCRSGFFDKVSVLLQCAQHARTECTMTGPASSSLSRLLQTAVECDMQHVLSCGSCIAYLRSLDTLVVYDIDQITRRLVAELPISHDVRQKYSTVKQQFDWLRPIVAAAVQAWGHVRGSIAD